MERPLGVPYSACLVAVETETSINFFLRVRHKNCGIPTPLHSS